MKRAILAVVVSLVPMAVFAQDGPAQAAEPVSGDAVVASSPAPASPDDADMQPRMGPARMKRRGSMGGYIEDATVGSGFRIRFDTGWDINSPDRAEFFYAKCGCFRTGVPAFDANAPGPGPGVVAAMNFNQLSMTTERQMGRRASVFVDLPFRWVKPTDFVPGTGSFGNQSGLADITVGTKVSVATSSSHDYTIMVRGSIPTGDSTKGLGSDHGSVEPALLVRQSLGSRFQIDGDFGYWHPTGSSTGPSGNGNFSGDILYYGIGPSFAIVNSRDTRFAPVVELVGWHVLSGYETSTFAAGGSGDASGLNVLNLNIGARLSLSGGGSLYAGYGWALTQNLWYDHILRFEYRTKL